MTSRTAIVHLSHLLLLLIVSTSQAYAQIPSAAGKNWQEIPGRALDVGAGADGSVWIIGENESPYRWNEDSFGWEQMSGSARRIAVLSDGTPVVVNKKEEIYKWRGGNWQHLPGRAIDIGAGADGSLWIIGENGSPYRWNEDSYSWEQHSGSARKIAVTADGTPVVVNKKEEVYKYRGANWQQLPGRAIDIGAGADGSLWIIGENESPYTWNEEAFAWTRLRGQARQITIQSGSTPWVVNHDGRIFRIMVLD